MAILHSMICVSESPTVRSVVSDRTEQTHLCCKFMPSTRTKKTATASQGRGKPNDISSTTTAVSGKEKVEKVEKVERVEKAVRDTTTTSTTNRIRARGKNAKASHHTPPENVRSGQLFYAPNQRVRKHRSTHGKIAPTSIYLTSKNHSTRRNGMEKALTARGSINNLRRSKHKPKA